MERSKKHYKIVIPTSEDITDNEEEEPYPLSARKIDKKVKLLEEFGFDKDFERKAKSPKICLADFFGNETNKKNFIRMAGYWQAYRKLKEEEKAVKYTPNRDIMKPDKPHIMDMNTKRRVIFEEQRKSRENLLPALKGAKSNCGTPRSSLNLEVRQSRGSDLKEEDEGRRVVSKSVVGEMSRYSDLAEMKKILEY